MTTIQLLQATLALLLSLQNNPNIPDTFKQQALAVANQVVQYVNTPQTLGVVTNLKDGAVWHASLEQLEVKWVQVKGGDPRWFSPPYVYIELEGLFGGKYAEMRKVSGIHQVGSQTYTVFKQNVPAGNYRLFVVGSPNPDTNIGAWALTPPVDIVVQ